MMDTLIATVEEGEQLSPEFIQTIAREASLQDAQGIYNTEEKNDASFRDSMIQIPHGFNRVYPRSGNQANYIKGMRENEICFCVGPAGTGKTYLAIAHALQMLLSKKMRKLVLTRPVVEAGENLGFLPGDLAQKIDPYLKPLYDAMESLIPYDVIDRKSVV